MRNIFARSLVAAVLLVLGASAAQAGGNKLVSVTQVPFSYWLDQQTAWLVEFQGRTSSAPFAPPSNLGVVDYCGKVADANHLSYGFSCNGAVKLTEFADGSGEVQVDFSFSNAINYAYDVGGTLIFGFTAGDLAAHPTDAPGLANGELQIKYTVPDASHPAYDLVPAIFFNSGGKVEQLKFHSVGAGPLRSGFGVPDGTPGQCNEENTGLMNQSGGGATADQWPCEKVEVKALGTGVSAVQSAGGAGVQKVGASGAAAAPAHGSWGAIKALYH